MKLQDIERLFTQTDGTYRFARWGRPIVPVVFGVDDATLGVIKGAIEALVFMAEHKMSDTDPELGANLLMFFSAIGTSWHRRRTWIDWCRISTLC